jgi:hypothetical protein
MKRAFSAILIALASTVGIEATQGQEAKPTSPTDNPPSQATVPQPDIGPDGTVACDLSGIERGTRIARATLNADSGEVLAIAAVGSEISGGGGFLAFGFRPVRIPTAWILVDYLHIDKVGRHYFGAVSERVLVGNWTARHYVFVDELGQLCNQWITWVPEGPVIKSTSDLKQGRDTKGIPPNAIIFGRAPRQAEPDRNAKGLYIVNTGTALSDSDKYAFLKNMVPTTVVRKVDVDEAHVLLAKLNALQMAETRAARESRQTAQDARRLRCEELYIGKPVSLEINGSEVRMLIKGAGAGMAAASPIDGKSTQVIERRCEDYLRLPQ